MSLYKEVNEILPILQIQLKKILIYLNNWNRHAIILNSVWYEEDIKYNFGCLNILPLKKIQLIKKF